jgi:hypothetical protein
MKKEEGLGGREKRGRGKERGKKSKGRQGKKKRDGRGMRKNELNKSHLPEEHYVGLWQRPGPGL